MRNGGPDLAALASKVEQLERRLAALESRRGWAVEHAERSAQPDGARAGAARNAQDTGQRDEPRQGAPVARPPLPADPDLFWALAGLRARSGEDGAVLFTGTVRLPGGGAVEWQQGCTTADVFDSDWSAAAEALGALGHPIRLLLLREVLHGRRTATELGAVDELGTTGQLYHHLRQLVAAGWLRSGGRGRYEVPAPRVIALLILIVAAQR